ncbi:MAG TPA: hypothetical protein VLB01_05915 [Thermodesulfobacteriota bacterium]|nr:hypothetical protein [Thermodesulfobacteriota bacterium]
MSFALVEVTGEGIMVEVNRRTHEEIVGEIVKSNDREHLIDQLSADLVFYSSVLRDIARGKDSANYHVLNLNSIIPTWGS